MSDVRHCAGCKGYSADWATPCPGMTSAEAAEYGLLVAAQTFVPRLRLRDRLRVLAGRLVVTGTRTAAYGGGGGGGYDPPSGQ